MVLAACCVSSVGCEQIATLGTVAGRSDPPPFANDASAQDASPDGPLTDGGVARVADGSRDAGSSELCPPQEVAGCDPVTNTGCSPDLQQQCAPDLTASTLAGYCAFSGPIADGGLDCFNSVFTESCPPTFTCFNGTCRALCSCDAQCGEGECCSERLGSQGFFLCEPC